MFTKTRHDSKTVLWKKENPLRVRDIVHKVRKLVLQAKEGECKEEATSHMQINWRRVKKLLFEFYLFRSSVTANSKAAVRRATVCVRGLEPVR